MLSTIRQFQKGILIVVTVLIVIAFAFLYADYDFVKGTVGTNDCVIRVNNRCYRVEEAQKLARYYNLANSLGMSEFSRTLLGPNRLDQDPTNFVFNLLVMRKEAERLGIEPTSQEIKNEVPKLPIFRHMPMADGRIIRDFLGGLGLDEGDLAQLTKDYLCFNKLQDFIGAGIQAVPNEVESTYVEQNQLYTASVVQFDRSDFEEAAKVSEEEIKKYFDDRNPPEKKSATEPENGELAEPAAEKPEQPLATDQPGASPPVLEPIMTSPQRGFHYAHFLLKELPEDATEEQKANNNRDFVKGVSRAYSELTAEGADFVAKTKEIAARKENPFIFKSGTLAPFKQTEPPEELSDLGRLLPALFSGTLRKGESSEPVGNEDGSYYVFQLSEFIEPRKMTLDEARPLITKALLAKKSNQLCNDAANAALHKIQEALNAGKSLLDTASANNLNLVTFPPFSQSEPPKDTDVDPRLILASVRDTAPGKLSSVEERYGGKGYFFSYVDKIEIYKDEEKADTIRMLEALSELEEKRTLFRSWLNQRGRQSGAARTDSILNYRVQ